MQLARNTSVFTRPTQRSSARSSVKAMASSKPSLKLYYFDIVSASMQAERSAQVASNFWILCLWVRPGTQLAHIEARWWCC